MSTSSSLIMVNSQFNGLLSPLDRGFNYGDGLFETLKVTEKGIALWEYHLQRLTQGCERLQIPLQLQRLLADREKFLAQARSLGRKTFVVKMIVTRGVGTRGYGFSGVEKPTYCLMLFSAPDYPRHYWHQGVNITVCRQRLSDNRALAGLKHLNKLEYVLARSEWHPQDYVEGLLCDSDSNVIEGTVSNVFAVRNSELVTPKLDRCGVAGVMRRLLIEKLAPTLGITVAETDIGLTDLYSAEEVFLTNSVNGVWPVKSVNERNYTAGEITLRLQSALNQYLEDWGRSGT